jgi:hypothetical protein
MHGTFNANQIGIPTNLELKIGNGKAGSGIAILKINPCGNGSSNCTTYAQATPYTELGWNGEDFSTAQTANLDLNNTTCTSATPAITSPAALPAEG